MKTHYYKNVLKINACVYKLTQESLLIQFTISVKIKYINFNFSDINRYLRTSNK